MYPNLNAELARKDVTNEELAKVLGLTPSTVSQKRKGSFGFTLKEAKAIKHFLNVDISLDVLFEEARG